ncbi:response regulator transcription factor [Prosthecobacter sp.]|uniref:response regulator transcription factor n=1 Tax=Prosthecobacter sp. TaxID=1965333 RepID=UPI0037830008
MTSRFSRSNLTKEQRLHLLLEALAILHDHDAGPFPERVLAACQHFLPDTCNSFEIWGRGDGSHEGAMNVPYDAADMQERFRIIGELAPTQNPMFQRLIAGDTEPMRLSDFTTLREIRRTEFFEMVFKPVGLKHQVAIPLNTATHLGAVTFNKGGSQDFTTEELGLISLFGRHTALAHQTARLLATVGAERQRAEKQDFLALKRRGLTRRQAEVLYWLVQGKRDREIAVILGISPRTAETHVRSILGKLGVETRAAAVAQACRACPAMVAEQLT